MIREGTEHQQDVKQWESGSVVTWDVMNMEGERRTVSINHASVALKAYGRVVTWGSRQKFLVLDFSVVNGRPFVCKPCIHEAVERDCSVHD